MSRLSMRWLSRSAGGRTRHSLAPRRSVGIRWLCTLWALAVVHGVGAEPDAAWDLVPASLTDGGLQATSGNIRGRLDGPASFEEDPAAMRFSPTGAGGARRVVVADSLTDVSLPAEQLTLAAWVKVEKPSAWAGFLAAIQDNGGYERGWFLGTDAAGTRFNFGLVSTHTNRLTYLTAPDPFVPGCWYFVAGTYDGATQRLFVDGRLAAAATAQRGPIAYPPRGMVVIGAYQDDNERHTLAGSLARVAWHARALTADEITAAFSARKSEFPGIEASPPPAVNGWPTYMHDSARSGRSRERLQLPLQVLWQHRPEHPPAPAWPEPARDDLFHRRFGLPPRVTFDRAFHLVAAGQRIYFGSSADDQVHCLDARTGRELWAFPAAAPVRLAPTIVAHRVVFGADDGRLYALEADSGSLCWQTQAAPERRWLPGNGRLISLWPVRSGVLAVGNTGYFCAGLFPGEGVYHGAVDLRNGKLLARKPIEASCQGYLVSRGGRLFCPTGRQPKGAWLAAAATRVKAVVSALPRLPADYSLAAVGASELCFGGGDGRVAAWRIADMRQVWSAEVDGRAYSLAICDGRLLVSTDQGVIYAFGASAGARPAASPPASSVSAVVPIRIDLAKRLVASLDSPRGYGLVVGDSATAPALALALAQQSELVLHALVPAGSGASALNRRLRAAGIGGRVTVLEAAGPQLPYADFLFNLVVRLDDWPGVDAPREAELERVLRPCGGLLCSNADGHGLTRRGPLPGAGDWTHFYADPANTACSSERRVGTAMSLQWFGLPGPRDMIDRHNRPMAPLCGQGRLFIAGNDVVFGVDAYNGTLLWRREIPDSARPAALKNAGSMAVGDKALFVAAGSSCLRLEPASGAVLARFAVPGEGDWGAVFRTDSVLLGSRTRPGASRWPLTPDSWRIAYQDMAESVVSDLLFAADPADGRLLWQQPVPGQIVNAAIGAADGAVFFVAGTDADTHDDPDGRLALPDVLANGAELAAVELSSGRDRWRRSVDLSVVQHVLFLSCSSGTVLLTSSRNHGGRLLYDLQAFAVTDGTPRWQVSVPAPWKTGGTHGEQTQHPVIVAGDVFVAGARVDLESGTRRDTWQWQRGGHGCGTLSACPTALFNRGSNPQMTLLADGQRSALNRVSRPGCWINIIPAAGLVLIPEASSGCTCPYPIQGSVAYRPR